VARAAIPSPGGSISSCINPNTGALRVVDAQAGRPAGVVGLDCGRYDARTVSLPPGTWEVTAQVLANGTARGFAQDNRREVACGPELNPDRIGDGGHAILAGVPDADLDVRAQWTWIVSNPGPANLTWNLGCVVSWPRRFNSVSDDTDVDISNSMLIARPVAAVVSS
jgi:hypothetical protein